MHDPSPKSLCPSTLILVWTDQKHGQSPLNPAAPPRRTHQLVSAFQTPGRPHSLLSLLPKPSLQFCELPDILALALRTLARIGFCCLHFRGQINQQIIGKLSSRMSRTPVILSQIISFCPAVPPNHMLWLQALGRAGITLCSSSPGLGTQLREQAQLMGI